MQVAVSRTGFESVLKTLEKERGNFCTSKSLLEIIHLPNYLEFRPDLIEKARIMILKAPN